MTVPDLAIRNARLRRRHGQFDILVDDGRIRGIEPAQGHAGTQRLDAAGGLLTESHVIAHLHLDKVDTLPLVGDRALHYYHAEHMTRAATAIRLAAQVKQHYRAAEIYSRAKQLCRQAFANGVTHLRAFADVDHLARLEAATALLQLRNELRGHMDLQVVAFPQEGLDTDPLREELLWKAAEAGCDVVGGIPWIEKNDRLRQRHIDRVFQIAQAHNRPLAFLADDAGNPRLRTTEMIARKTKATGWQGRVAICHARAMSLYARRYLNHVTRLLRATGISLIVNPHTAPLCAPVRHLLARGINVALGQDDCHDAYYPYGRGHMLEVAFLASHLLRFVRLADMDKLYDMIATNAARAIGIAPHGVEAGAEANLLVYAHQSVQELLRFQPTPSVVIRRGRILVENRDE